MRHYSIGLFLCLLVSIAVSGESYFKGTNSEASSANQIAIRCGHLIGGKSADGIAGAVILIEGDRIVAVGRDVKIPAGARVIDLSNATVLPGLIDTHTHQTYHYNTTQNERPA